MLGTSILWFERDYDAGVALPPEQWRELCLASVTTHDLPPTAGYLAGEHIRIRDDLGLLTRPVEEERRVDEADRLSWLTLLVERGWLAADAMHDVRCRHAWPCTGRWRRPRAGCSASHSPTSSARPRAMNQPGTHEEYPNWQLPLADGERRPGAAGRPGRARRSQPSWLPRSAATGPPSTVSP